MICKNTIYREVRFRAGDPIRPYYSTQINLRKIAVEETNLKLNHQLQGRRCRCERCNPDTTGGDLTHEVSI